MKKLLLLALVISVHASAYAATGFSTVEERMTGKEFKETGLVKLTDEELAALNDWLRRHSVATLENAKAPPASSVAGENPTEDDRGFEYNTKDGDPIEDIHSTIVGTFDGWRGKGTVFTLANGMVWQQQDDDTFYIKPVENPEVIVKKGLFSRWELSVAGYGSSIRVKRIK
ncbi:MAG: hypothetical protein PVF46_03985 [Lysobacterales bacterium]|jgi:hypothetical protein